MVGKLKYIATPFILGLVMLLGIQHSRAFTEAEQAAPQSQQPPAGAGLSAVILYKDDATTAGAYANLLKENGFTASTLQINSKAYTIYLPLITSPRSGRSAAATQQAAAASDFSKVDLIIIGPDTGSGDQWNIEDDIFDAIVASGKPVIGIGDGGYAYFGRAQLAIGSPHGEIVQAQAIKIAEFGNSQRFYEKPNNSAIQADVAATLYNANQTTIALPLSNPIPGGVRLASLDSDSGKYPLVTEEKNMLWGFNGTPADMTELGQRLFINALAFSGQGVEIELKGRTITPDAGIDSAISTALELNTPVHVMAQLYALPTPEERQMLEDAGITLLDFIGKTVYQAAVSDKFDPQNSAVTDLVRWMGLFLPVDKIDPKIRKSGYEAWADNGDGTVNLLAITFADVTDAAAQEKLNALAESVSSHGNDTWAIVLNKAKLDNLLAEDIVAWVEEGPEPMQIINDVVRNDLNVDVVQNANINSGSIFYNGLDGTGVNVGVFDTGLFTPTFSHNDFAGRVLRTQNDTDGHGTHVAGIIAASGANSVSNCPGGVCTDFQLRGMAPAAQVAPYGSSNGAIWDEAVNTHGIEVSNHSYVMSCSGYNTRAQTIDTLVRGDLTNGGTSIPQHMAVWAAANQGTSAQWCTTATVPDGPDDNDLPDPDRTSGARGYYSVLSQAKNPLVIGGSNRLMNNIVSFSSRGPTFDGRIKPDLMATACSTSTDHDSQGYVTQCGTSMASPAAAGVVTLLTEQFHNTFPTAGRPMPATLKAVMIQTAVDMVHHPGQADFAEYGWNDPDTGQPVIYHEGPDWATGYGRIDASAAVAAIRGRSFVEGTVQPSNTTDTFTIEVENRDQLKFTLAWDDEAGNPALAHNASKLVNDLDLTLIAPNGVVFRPLVLPALPKAAYDGNNLDNGTADPIVRNTHIVAASPGIDRLNNVEQVIVDNPIDGTWTVRVNAFALPNSNPQKYALAGDFRTLNIVSPQTGDEADAGDPADPNVILVVLEAESTGAGGGVSTLADAVAADFSVDIEGTAATILNGLPVGDQFWLNVRPAPNTYSGGVRYDLKVTWNGYGNDSETNAVLFTEKLVTDRSVVIDYSFSMNDYDKMAAAKAAARLFVDRSLVGDRIAVTGFSNQANTTYAISAVTNNIGNPELANAKNAVNSFSPFSNTAIGKGLLEGQAQVTAAPADHSERDVILLLSDGMENVDPYYDTPAVKGVIEPSSTIIHTVSVGPASAGHHTLLEEIADDNGGDNYPVTADSSTRAAAAVHSGVGIDAWPSALSNRLSDVYNQIAESILYENRLLQVVDLADPKAGEDIWRVEVPKGLKRLTAAVNWSKEGQLLTLELTSPSGQVFEYKPQSGDPTCRDDVSHQVCIVDAPESGVWKIRLIYIKANRENEFALWVSGNTSIQFDVKAANDGRAIATGEPVQIIGMLSEFGKPLPKQSVKVNVFNMSAGSSRPTTIVLMDDGQHGDGEANDGIYGGKFVGESAGPYAIRGMATGTGGDDVPFELYDNDNFHLSPKAIYVYKDQLEKAEAYKALIEDNGIVVDVVQLADVPTINMHYYDLAIIGPETGYAGNWGDAEAYEHIVENKVPVLGLGKGGYAFLGKGNWYIGWPHGAHGSSHSIVGDRPSDGIWHSPYHLPFAKKTVQLYTEPSPVVQILLNNRPNNVEVYGFHATDAKYGDILMQSDWHMLWGFDHGPGKMTKDGRELFVNAVYRTMR